VLHAIQFPAPLAAAALVGAIGDDGNPIGTGIKRQSLVREFHGEAAVVVRAFQPVERAMLHRVARLTVLALVEYDIFRGRRPQAVEIQARDIDFRDGPGLALGNHEIVRALIIIRARGKALGVDPFARAIAVLIVKESGALRDLELMKTPHEAVRGRLCGGSGAGRERQYRSRR